MSTAQNTYFDQYEALDSRVNHLNVPETGGVVTIDHYAYNILEVDAAITCTLESVNAIPVGVEVLVIAQASCTVNSQSLSSGEHVVFKVTKDSNGDKQWVITSWSTTLTSTSFLDDAELTFGTGSDAVVGWETGDADNHTLVIGLGDSNQALHITDKAAIATDWAVSADTHPTLYIHSNTTPATDYITIGAHDGTSATINVVGGTTLSFDIGGTTIANLTASGIQLQDDDAVIFGTGSDASILFDGTDTIFDTATGSTIDFQINSAEIASVQVTGLAVGAYVVAGSTAGDNQLTLQSTGTAPTGTGADVGHLYADFETDDDELFWLSGTVGTATQLTT